MKFFLFLSFLCFVLLYTACTKPVEFDLESIEEKLVVNCVFSPDSLWQVYVSKNLAIDDTFRFESIRGAEVRLYAGEDLVALLNDFVEPDSDYGIGYYTDLSISYLPLADTEYTLKVTHTDWGEAFAKNAIPPLPAISTLDFSVLDLQAFAGSPVYNIQAQLSFEIQDKKNEPNYYAIRLYYFGDYVIQHEGGTIQYVDTLIRKHLGFEVENNLASFRSYLYGGDLVFTDETFNGETLNIRLKIHSSIDLKNTQPHTIFMDVISMSRDYYDYQKTFTQQVALFNAPFAEPVTVFSNIHNGYGIFAGFDVRTFRIDF